MQVILAKSDNYSTDDQGNAQPVWRILDAEVVNNATTENVFGGILDGAMRSFNDLSSDITDANSGRSSRRCQPGLEPGR